MTQTATNPAYFSLRHMMDHTATNPTMNPIFTRPKTAYNEQHFKRRQKAKQIQDSTSNLSILGFFIFPTERSYLAHEVT